MQNPCSTSNNDTIHSYPFGMGMPTRSWSAVGENYRFGFNGKENDDQTYGDNNEINYGFRIYDPRLGRFLSDDPVTKSYPYYTPYQFAGNSPIEFVDLDGLEKGKLKVTNTDAQIALLTWQIIYYVVNSGPGAVGSPKLLQSDEFKKDFNEVWNTPDNTIYVNQLPIQKDDNGNYTYQDVKLSSKHKWKNGRAWKITVNWDIQIVNSEHPQDLGDVNSCLLEDYAEYGVIEDESGPGGPSKLTTYAVAAGVADQTTVSGNIIYLNSDCYGTNPTQSASIDKAGANNADLVSHEMGHNFGLNHSSTGDLNVDYGQDGLMSNKNGVIRPTREIMWI